MLAVEGAIVEILHVQHPKQCRKNRQSSQQCWAMFFVIYILNSKFVNSIMNKLNIYSCILQLPQFPSKVVEANVVDYMSVVPNSVGAGVSNIVGRLFST